MKATLYELYVAEGALDLTHGNFITIREIYIPSLGICFNSKGFAFKTNRGRYRKNKEKTFNQPDPKRLGVIEISKVDANKILQLVNSRKTVNKLGRKIFEFTGDIYDES